MASGFPIRNFLGGRRAENRDERIRRLQFTVDVTVKNVGTEPGKDVVQLYVTAPYDPESKYHVEKPLVSLAAFEKTAEIQPGQTDTVTLTWNARDIACYSDTAECYVLEQGSYQFCVSTNANTAPFRPGDDAAVGQLRRYAIYP